MTFYKILNYFLLFILTHARARKKKKKRKNDEPAHPLANSFFKDFEARTTIQRSLINKIYNF